MKLFFYSTIIITFFAGCKKDFLTNTDDGTILIRQEYVVDLTKTGEFLNGIYPLMSLNLYNGYLVVYPELVADNVKPVIGSSGITPLGFQYNWAQQEDETAPTGAFTIQSLNCNGVSYTAYQIIRACNFVLEKATEYRGENPAKADIMIGQALAIRALTYFTLVNVFAQSYNFTTDASHPGIALVNSSNWTAPISTRNTVGEVYTQLITDLNKAINLLEPATTTLLMNRNAAKALLARVYLFKGDFEQAKELAIGISKEVPIMTTNYPAKLFTPEETEALFQLPPGPSAMNPFSFVTFANSLFRTRNQFQASFDIASIIRENANDLRKNWVTAASANWSVTKFPLGVLAEPTSDKANAYYQTVFRSSEMYLTAAECYANLHNEDSARFYLNAIQKRANVTLTSYAVTGAALLDSIYKERRKELAFEGFRMYDLQRWKKGVSRADAISPAVKNLPYPSSKAIAPIPGQDVNVLGLHQNDEY